MVLTTQSLSNRGLEDEQYRLIRRKIKPNKAECPNKANLLKNLAIDRARIDMESAKNAESISALPIARQLIDTDKRNAQHPCMREIG
jgi:hypothetical protein